MKWTYSIQNKMTASAILLSLCLLVLFSHFIDRNHTKNVKTAISTLYEDRLIAENYILKMTSGVYQIRDITSSDTNSVSKMNHFNNLLLTIREANTAYQKTKFTEIEKRKAGELLLVIAEFDKIDMGDPLVKSDVANKALHLLNELSTIQLEESKQIMDRAESLYISGKTSSQFVFAILVVILIVLQALVFASKPLIPHTIGKSPRLN